MPLLIKDEQPETKERCCANNSPKKYIKWLVFQREIVPTTLSAINAALQVTNRAAVPGSSNIT